MPDGSGGRTTMFWMKLYTRLDNSLHIFMVFPKGAAGVTHARGGIGKR